MNISIQYLRGPLQVYPFINKYILKMQSTQLTNKQSGVQMWIYFTSVQLYLYSSFFVLYFQTMHNIPKQWYRLIV